MKKITLKYIVINFIAKILPTIQVEGQPAYARRRFLRTLKTHVGDLEAEQKELQQKLADKDEKTGELKTNQGSYVFNAANRKTFNKKWDELNDQEVTMDVTAENEADVTAMQTVLRAEADRFEKEQVKDGKFDADTFEFITSMREAADLLTSKE